MKLIGGIVLLCAPIGGIIATGYSGYPASAFWALMLGLCLWLLVSGIFGLGGKSPSWAVVGGVVGATLVLGTFLGPVVSESWARSNEEAKFEELVEASEDPGFMPERWKWDYENEIDERFHRPEWEGHYALARVREAIETKNSGSLRALLKELREKDEDDEETAELYAKAAKEAEKEFGKIYDAAKEKMSAAVGTGKREIPVDPDLRNAFALLLDDLSTATDATVHVAFVNEAILDEPAGAAILLAQMRRSPEARLDFPKGDAPVIDEGDAFSPAYDSRRRATFIKAMNESFHQVFAADGLFELKPLGKDESRKGKLVFEVDSKIFRIPDYFFYTNTDDNGIKRLKGFLFAIEVEWGFNVYDRKGKAIYKPERVRSAPAQDVKIASDPADPSWAAYSIMMDSAYYNYARQVTGKFGLTPPPVKQVFSYSGADVPPGRVSP